VKKEDKEKINLKSNLYSKQNIEIENFKTTNVNILLNRVRLDKKKTFKKKNYFFIYFYIDNNFNYIFCSLIDIKDILKLKFYFYKYK
tara:strand:+ start:55 stop:315 length:261 start_codon:yes stop_codon:yes gene_type:complete